MIARCYCILFICSWLKLAHKDQFKIKIVSPWSEEYKTLPYLGELRLCCPETSVLELLAWLDFKNNTKSKTYESIHWKLKKSNEGDAWRWRASIIWHRDVGQCRYINEYSCDTKTDTVNEQAGWYPSHDIGELYYHFVGCFYFMIYIYIYIYIYIKCRLGCTEC